MESCCIYICSVGPIEDCCVMLLPRFHPHASAWWAPSNRFYAGLAGFAETCIGPILRVLQSGIRAQQLRYPTSPACRITYLTAEVECQNYFCKIGWIVLVRSAFTPYPSAVLLLPLRVLNLLSSLSSSPGFFVVGFPSYLQGFAFFLL